MLTKIYLVAGLLFLAILLIEWSKRKDAPIWVVVFGALFWPVVLLGFIVHMLKRV